MQSTSRERANAAVRSGWSVLRECVRVETRSLALFRILVALLILADLGLRSRNFSQFYTEDGLVPQSLATGMEHVNGVSVYFLSTEPAVTAALFAVQALVAVALLVGYRTRIATVVSVVFVVSLDLRNPLVVSYADVLFAWLLFWAIFLPLGERWSVDAVHRDRPPRASVATLGSAAILGQMVTMYVVNGYHKTTSELWQTGEAAVLVLGLDDMTFLLADLVRSVPTVLQVGGLTWFVMLLGAWLLILLRGRARTAFVGLFLAGHLAFAVTVRIGAFAFVAIAGLLLFLQSSFWTDLEAVARWGGVPVAALESRLAGLERVAEVIPRPKRWLGIGSWLVTNPYKILLAVGVVTLATLTILSALSAGGIVETDAGPVETTTDGADAFVTHQTQWRIFAPQPRTTDRYYVFPAETESGEVIDVYNDRELSFERPEGSLEKQYDTYRERFYMNSVSADEPPGTADRLAERLCTEWNEANDDDLVTVNMYRVDESVTLETIDAPADRDRESTYFHWYSCDDSEPTTVASPPF
ncbi:HTTM domain-containing protein [Salinadaptatus halalkaliphilus]|uniref:HTTM domain-containing protein n=1 Tax=Salinadaptatus halalkaliphilus TaxID=2419781 RepID=A0A4V3VLH2_9EURY|nr:HTTM domain-containing protein [Salinadaptatus halalkaliphilus]THE65547.1 HTTM domain-containing protein [Salinadaptatus halalkaliphilus]